MDAEPNVTSVQRALTILEALDGASRGLNISEVSRRLRLPKSTAHVIILTLERSGYVVRNPNARTYSLSSRAYALGRETMQNLVLPKLSLPNMRWLADKTKLTVHLAVLEKNQATYVQKVDGPGLIRFDTFIGKRTSLHCTAVGKVLLAYSPEMVQREFLSKTTFSRYTRKTVFIAPALKNLIAEVRARGYAFEDQEEELDVRCLAVPVLRFGKELMAAIGVTGTVGQVPLDAVDDIVRLLHVTAASISEHVDLVAAAS